MKKEILLEEEVMYEVPFKFVAAAIIALSLFLVIGMYFLK